MKMGLETNRMGVAVLGTMTGEGCMEQGVVRELGQVMVTVGWVTETALGGGVRQVEKVGGALEAAGLKYVCTQNCKPNESPLHLTIFIAVIVPVPCRVADLVVGVVAASGVLKMGVVLMTVMMS